MDKERDVEQIYRAISQLEKTTADSVSNLKQQVAELLRLPTEVALLKAHSEHQAENVERIGASVDDNSDQFRQEVASMREKTEKNNEFAIERFDSLAKSLQSVADRIETKFTQKIEDIKNQLTILVNDYDKRIATMKGIATAVSIGFTVLQGVAGLAISSYVNGWKTRVEESEVAIKDIRKNDVNLENLIKELQQESLARRK